VRLPFNIDSQKTHKFSTPLYIYIYIYIYIYVSCAVISPKKDNKCAAKKGHTFIYAPICVFNCADILRMKRSLGQVPGNILRRIISKSDKSMQKGQYSFTPASKLTWSLTLREERRLRVSENRVLKRIFGHKRDEVTEE